MFALWRLRYKYVFEDEVSSLFSFCHMWGEKVCMQLLARGFLLIKGAKLLESSAYSDFIPVLVTLKKRM
jgi:hypothetical protein